MVSLRPVIPSAKACLHSYFAFDIRICSGKRTATGVERLASLDDEEVLDVGNIGVLSEVVVLGSHEHTLTEEVL